MAKKRRELSTPLKTLFILGTLTALGKIIEKRIAFAYKQIGLCIQTKLFSKRS